MKTAPGAEPSPSGREVWAQVLASLAQKVDPHSFQTWFRPLRCGEREGSLLDVTVPNETFRQWLLEHYSNLLEEALRQADAALQLRLSLPTPAPSSPLPEPSPAPWPVVRASALEALHFRPPWLVEGLWTAQAVGILGGPPKSCKSWLALELAVAVASGSPALGTFPVPRSGPVLFYAAEDSPSATRWRLQSLAESRQLPFNQLDVWVITADSLRLDRAADQERLEATLAQHRPVLLVLDPLVRLHSLDENVAGQVAALLSYLRALQRKTGLAIVLVHHARKSLCAVGGVGYSLRGSSDLYAWVDSFLYLQRRRDQLTLSAEHRSAPGLGPLALELVETSCPGPHLRLASPLPLGTSPAENPLPAQILELLAESPKPQTVDQLRARLQVRNQRVVEALRQLSARAQVVRLARGYALNSAYSSLTSTSQSQIVPLAQDCSLPSPIE